MYAIWDKVQKTWMKAVGTEHGQVIRFVRIFETEKQAKCWLVGFMDLDNFYENLEDTNLFEIYEIRKVTIIEEKV